MTPPSTIGEIACDTGSAAIARASGLSSRTLARRRAAATAEAAICALSARMADVSLPLIIVNQNAPPLSPDQPEVGPYQMVI
jgi:hypothetical protein